MSVRLGVRLAFGLAAAVATASVPSWQVGAQTRPGAPVPIDTDDIGGVVTSAQGPEAGVWVIAETSDLPTRFLRIVTTDDQGRYVVPDLPSATYRVWARGYGLVDSSKASVKPGVQWNITASKAPDAKAAAQIYPANYWLSLLKLPPGEMSPQELASAIKRCMGCHQIGDESTRLMPKSLGTFDSSLKAWDRRVQSGWHGSNMSSQFMRLRGQRAMFAEWTDRIAAGAVPRDTPRRPQGVERNLVVTMWDWGRESSYVHDATPADRRDPRGNANGIVYGGNQSDDTIVWVDPVKNTAGEIPLPPADPKLPVFGSTASLAPSPYFGAKVPYDARTQPRNPTMDERGRLWTSVAVREPLSQPAYCKAGSSNKFAAYFPLGKTSVKHVQMFDPKTKEFSDIDTCYPTDHFDIAEDRDHTVYTGASVFQGQGSVVGWINARVFDQTHSAEASQGWCPGVLDTNGDGKITTWTEPNEPIDPTKDHRIEFSCYALSLEPANQNNIWCAGGGGGTRIVRLERGANPPQTCKAEVYEAPAGVLDSGGIDVDSKGVVWADWRGTTHVTSFDRSKCKVTNGPTATGKHCPEGWTSYKIPGPAFEGTDISADLTYLSTVDRHDALGLGKDVPIVFTDNSDALTALLPGGRYTLINIPYPMGFFTRSLWPRIDDPRTGWKGKALWTSFAPYAPWHIEGGLGTKSKAVKLQVRPNPLAK
jgi:hypothetical protein